MFFTPLKLNVLKSQVSLFKFMSGNNQLQIIDKYWYLGLIFTEFLSYDDMAKSVAQSATRALGLVIAKCKVHGGVPFNVNKKILLTILVFSIETFTCIYLF